MDSKAANKASSPLPTALTTSRNTQIVPIVSRRICFGAVRAMPGLPICQRRRIVGARGF